MALVLDGDGSAYQLFLHLQAPATASLFSALQVLHTSERLPSQVRQIALQQTPASAESLNPVSHKHALSSSSYPEAHLDTRVGPVLHSVAFGGRTHTSQRNNCSFVISVEYSSNWPSGHLQLGAVPILQVLQSVASAVAPGAGLLQVPHVE